MPAVSDYLLKTSGGTIQANLFVRLLNNATGVSYISDAVTDANGKFTFNTNPPPPGGYTVFTGPTGTIAGTPNPTGDTNYLVPVTTGDDIAAHSVTVLPSGPYAPSAAAGYVDALLADRGGQVYNVKSARFGAKGDGVTIDTTAILAALAVAGTTGGVVYLPPGTYLIDAALTIAQPGILLLGANTAGSLATATVITTNSATANMIVFGAGINNCGLANVSLNTTVTRTNGAAISISSGIVIRISNVDMTGQFNGLVTGTATVVSVDKGYWQNFATNGTAVVIQGGNDHYLHNLSVDNPSGSQPAAGINIQASAGTWIESCDIIHSGTGLLINPSVGNTVSWLFAINSAFDLCTARGAMIGGGAGTIKGINLTGCWTSSSVNNDGIYIGSGAGITNGVRVVAHRSFNNGTNGIYVDPSCLNVQIDSSNVAGNSVLSPGTNHGIVVAASGTSVTMTRSGQHAGFGNTQNAGIITTGAITNYTLIGNDLRGNTVGLNDAATGTPIKQVLGNTDDTGGVPSVITTSGKSNSFQITDTGGSGANLKLLGNGGTTPSKTIGAFSGSLRILNDAFSAAILTLSDAGALGVTAGIQPGTPALAAQGGNLYMGSGVPSNGNGTNGDFYLRTDGTEAGHTILYHKETGAWVATAA